MKLLILDKNTDLSEKTKSALKEEKENLNIDTSNSGKEAIEMFNDNEYDAIISEYELSDKNGIEVLKEIRKEKERIPFILFTDIKEKEPLTEGINLGINHYLEKKDDISKQASQLIEIVGKEIEQAEKIQRYEKEQRLLEELMERIPDTIYFKDKDAKFVKISKSKLEELGEDEESVIGKTDYDFYSEEEAEEMEKDDKKVMEKEEPVIGREEKINDPEGREWWASATKVPRYDEDGNVIGMMGISRDITERKKAEQKLEKTRERFEKFFNANPDPVFIIDENGFFEEINDAFCELLGGSEEEVIGTKLDDVDFIPIDSRDKARRKFKKRRSGEEAEPYTIEADTKEGDRIMLEINATTLKTNGETTGIIGIGRNVTKKRKMLELMKENEQKFREIVSDTILRFVDLMEERREIEDIDWEKIE